MPSLEWIKRALLVLVLVIIYFGGYEHGRDATHAKYLESESVVLRAVITDRDDAAARATALQGRIQSDGIEYAKAIQALQAKFDGERKRWATIARGARCVNADPSPAGGGGSRPADVVLDSEYVRMWDKSLQAVADAAPLPPSIPIPDDSGSGADVSLISLGEAHSVNSLRWAECRKQVQGWIDYYNQITAQGDSHGRQ